MTNSSSNNFVFGNKNTHELDIDGLYTYISDMASLVYNTYNKLLDSLSKQDIDYYKEYLFWVEEETRYNRQFTSIRRDKDSTKDECNRSEDRLKVCKRNRLSLFKKIIYGDLFKQSIEQMLEDELLSDIRDKMNLEEFENGFSSLISDPYQLKIVKDIIHIRTSKYFEFIDLYAKDLSDLDIYAIWTMVESMLDMDISINDRDRIVVLAREELGECVMKEDGEIPLVLLSVLTAKASKVNFC